MQNDFSNEDVPLKNRLFCSGQGVQIRQDKDLLRETLEEDENGSEGRSHPIGTILKWTLPTRGANPATVGEKEKKIKTEACRTTILKWTFHLRTDCS